MNKYKAIIFDLRNVIFHCSFDNIISSWSLITGKSQDYIRNVIENDVIHKDFEKGQISSEKFINLISTKVGAFFNV